MSTRAIVSLAVGAFRAESSLTDDLVLAKMHGVADMQAGTKLEELVDKTHNEAIRAGVAMVSLDLRDLEFMSSSCILKLVGWLKRLEASPTKYKLRIVCSPTHHWQKRSLTALRAFAGDNLIVENG